MLQGLGQRKVRLRQLFGSSSRCPFEDAITSTIFGPLQFLPVEDAWKVTKVIARRMAVPEALLPSQVDDVDIRFWPNKETKYRTRGVEPDFVVEATLGGNLVLRLIVEVKWGASLGVDQLAAEWDAFSAPDQARTHHLLLVHDPHRHERLVEKELKQWEADHGTQDRWRDRLEVRSWRDLSYAFQDLLASAISPGVRRWGELVIEVLRHEDVSAQVGWDRAGLLPVSTLSWEFV